MAESFCDRTGAASGEAAAFLESAFPERWALPDSFGIDADRALADLGLEG